MERFTEIKKPCVLYLRVSSSKQQMEGYSLETQAQECLKFLQRIGKIIKSINNDVHTSKEKNELDKIITRNRNIDIVVYDISRFSRYAERGLKLIYKCFNLVK